MVVATGFFDGVHLGHRYILQQLTDYCHRIAEESVVVTFWPHPRTVLQDGAISLRLLSSLQEKNELLRSAGVDRVEVTKFSREFSALTAEQYLRDYLQGQLGADTVFIGYDNRMGADRAAPEQICKIAAGIGMKAVVAEKYLSEDGVAISSTKIRTAISEGDVKGAAKMLGYRYGLHGVVVSGARIGRSIGFPTANMQLYEPLKIVPGNGVYLVEAETVGRNLWGMCNIGIRPTLSDGNALTIETYLFDFDEDIYGLEIKLRFVEKIREEERFDSLNALSRQLAEDKLYCLSLIGNSL